GCGSLPSGKIYSILASGRPYLFVGPRDSHIVSDVLEPCAGGFHVENGDVDGFLEVIEKVKRLSIEERPAINLRNRAFVASQFNRRKSPLTHRRPDPPVAVIPERCTFSGRKSIIPMAHSVHSSLLLAGHAGR